MEELERRSALSGEGVETREAKLSSAQDQKERPLTLGNGTESDTEVEPTDTAATEAETAPDFTSIVSSAQQRSAERAEERRRRAEALAREQQRRWDAGIVLLKAEARPLLERALQACVEEGIPAILEDNFGEQAAAPRLLFYCSSKPEERDGQQLLGAESIRLVLESDGKSVRAGTAKSFSSYAEGLRPCDDVDETVTTLFSAVLESYFESCERAQTGSLGTN